MRGERLNHSIDDRENTPRASPTAAGALFDQLYSELRRIADSYLHNERAGHTLQPTALVHEAYLRLAEVSAEWADPIRFRALAARVMRNVLINHALARKAEKRGGGRTMISLEAEPSDPVSTELDIEGLDIALRRLAELDERKARVVELRFFGGLKADETARELNISLSTVEADWRMAKAWLRGEINRG